MTSLRKLAIVECRLISNKGFKKLSALTSLHELYVKRCRTISEDGMECLQNMPQLHTFRYLSYYEEEVIYLQRNSCSDDKRIRQMYLYWRGYK